MERVGLVELHHEKGCGGVQVHDMMHEFAVKEAKNKEGVEMGSKKRAEECSAGGVMLVMSKGKESFASFRWLVWQEGRNEC